MLLIRGAAATTLDRGSAGNNRRMAGAPPTTADYLRPRVAGHGETLRPGKRAAQNGLAAPTTLIQHSTRCWAQ